MQMFAATKNDRIQASSAMRIFDLIGSEMKLVEDEFMRQADSNIQVIGYLGNYLRASGGKRLRPALLILAVYAAGGDGKNESAIRLATVMEMLHTATLVHDDIIDNAGLRRNRQSVNARFGNQTAVLMGDWLYMSAFEASLKERSLEILDILTRLTRKMTEGELVQLTMLGNADITEEEYFDILRRKTAYLFSGCCEIGAILGLIGPPGQAALRDYGMDLGVAFQLADDILDFTADEALLGKAAGADLLEGKVTLPLIRLLRHEPTLRKTLREIMYDGEYAPGIRDEIIEKLRVHGVLEDVRNTARNFATEARKNLELLPETEYSLALDAVPDFVVERRS
jgi:octaprenyl-diphosphate synthase